MLHRDGRSAIIPDSSDWQPVSDRYAHLPVELAFTWADCLDSVGPGEWYMVAFRSVRTPGLR